MYSITIKKLLDQDLQAEIAKSYTINAYLILKKDKFFHESKQLSKKSKFTKNVNSYFPNLSTAIKRLETNKLENCIIVKI